MLSVPTALLLHTTPTGRHYDWLVGTPHYGGDPEARLWTARLAHPSEAWRGLSSFNMTEIAPHRAAYLTYQGPISDGRGHVRRVDQGTAVIHQWREGQIVLAIRLQHFQGRIQAEKTASISWRARIIG